MNKKIYEKVIKGNSDSNIDFNDFKNLVIALGFSLARQKGSHMIYRHNVTGARLYSRTKLIAELFRSEYKGCVRPRKVFCRLRGRGLRGYTR